MAVRRSNPTHHPALCGPVFLNSASALVDQTPDVSAGALGGFVAFVGFAVVLLACSGCAGAVRESRKTIAAYICVLGVVVVVQLVVAAVAVAFLAGDNRARLSTSLGGAWANMTADQQAEIEQLLECCGFNASAAPGMPATTTRPPTTTLPPSTAAPAINTTSTTPVPVETTTTPPRSTIPPVACGWTGGDEDQSNLSGCGEVIASGITRAARLLGGTGLVLAMLEVVGVLLSIWLYTCMLGPSRWHKPEARCKCARCDPFKGARRCKRCCRIPRCCRCCCCKGSPAPPPAMA